MLSKQDYISQQKAKEQWARTLGYSDLEIRRAYQVAREGRGVNYLELSFLEEARELLTNKK